MYRLKQKLHYPDSTPRGFLVLQRLLVLVLYCALASATAIAGDATATYRGNLQRTGSDGSTLPPTPKVLWVYQAPESFLGAPVVQERRLFISGLGTFNVSTFYCLNTDLNAHQRVRWSKTAPLLQLPIVSSPAIVGEYLVFGDGMHTTDGGHLHALRTTDGLPLWQLSVPGNLVHLEGSPTIAGQRVYVGGGAAGVMCVDPEHLTLNGKKLSLAELQQILDHHWKDLHEKYEVEKKADPDFAVPPSVDQLPKPKPQLVWQVGQQKWHVDAPVAMVGDGVLAASAYLEKENRGERALFCLNADTGALRWRAPLKVNPWGGPSVEGDTVIVGGSSIGYYLSRLRGARGDVTSLRLSDGKVRWRREVPGGVLSSLAIVEGLAVATATDGKVRAFDLAGGNIRWEYNAKSPFFAGPAVAAGVVYAGDLAGVLHAIDLESGRPKWTLDLAKDPAIKTPGMIYGSPVVYGGRLYVATCNIEGPNAGRPCSVVCLGRE